jgi:hypothetical protein
MARKPTVGTPAHPPDEILNDPQVEKAKWTFGISDEKLLSPTLGAYRREHGITDDMSEFARVAFAFELVQEARRRAIIDQLDGVLVGLTRLADPDVIARRLRRIADMVDGGEQITEQAA